MNFKNLFSSIVILPTLLLTSCATIVNGPTQKICFTSQPPHANIWVDNFKMGSTPIALDLARSQNHFVHIELDGYEPFDMQIHKRMSKWAIGNIVFGGIIGIVIDLATGSIYKLTPEQVHIHLAETGKSCSTIEGGFISVVLTPDASWEKIGQLTAR